MGGAKAKSPPENIIPMSAVNKVKPSTAAGSAITNEAPGVPIIPALPPIVAFKQTHWTCSKCHIELPVTSKRCGTCRKWQGGKRGRSTKKQSSQMVNEKTPLAIMEFFYIRHFGYYIFQNGYKQL